jgi:gentisate 1,2-dioxygenase
MAGQITVRGESEAPSFPERLSSLFLAPLWHVMDNLVPKLPTPRMHAHIWEWSKIGPAVRESAEIVSTQQAERRVLILENPAYTREARATSTLYAGVQLVMPGEIARAHRHTQSALRFTLESNGGYTTVDGERVAMQPGDFVITPSWAFHDHCNEGAGPVIWLDVLDIPMISFFELGFSESHDARQQTPAWPAGHANARFGSGLLPLEEHRPYGATSPMFHYSYARSRAAVCAVAAGRLDPHWGASLRYSNPLAGGWAMPTISSWLMHLPAGFVTAPVRSTDGIVMTVAEGSGKLLVGDERIAFGQRDIMAIPNWTWRSIEAKSDCFLFCCSDRAIQEKIGLWREEKREGNDAP